MILSMDNAGCFQDLLQHVCIKKTVNSIIIDPTDAVKLKTKKERQRSM